LVGDGELVDSVGNIGADEDMPSWLSREWRRQLRRRKALMSAITTCHCGEVFARRLQVKALPMPEQAPVITVVLMCMGGRG